MVKEYAISNGDKVMNAEFNISTDKLAEFCKRWQILEFSLFGSVLRDDFGPESDIDVLVRFEPHARHTLFNLVDIKDELSSTLGRKVDLIERAGVENSPNYIRRNAILQSAKTLYSK